MRSTSKRNENSSGRSDGGKKKNTNYMYSVTPHPNSVKPLGNIYFEKPTYNVRAYGLGEFRVLEDEFIVDIMKLLDEVELCRMCRTSKAFYVFAQLDDVWKEMVLDTFDGNFQFELTWKFTFAKARVGANNAVIPQPLAAQGFYSDSIFSRWYGAHIDLWKWGQADNIERRSALSNEEFIKDYGLPNKPCIVTDIVPNWPAFKSWSKSQLLADFGDTPFKTDNGVSLKLVDYMTYCERIHETIPIYVFDNDFGEKAPRLLTDYIIPSYFSEDFFNVLGPKDRPSFRWILIGPPRSGSSFHKDPNSTSAWNGLISGAKKWIFLPPEVTPPGVFPSDDGWEVSTPEAVVDWFMDFYSEIKKYNPIECVQRPGELVFVPSGWWHTALNLEESIAVTQNVVNSSNLHRVIKFLASKKNQELYEAFMNNMREKYPDVLEAALERMKEDKPKMSFWDQVLQPKEETNNANNFSFSFGFDVSE